MGQGLSISSLVQVSVNLQPNATQAQNLNRLLVLGSSTVIDPVTRERVYTSLAAIATDFGTSAPEYLAAQAWFSQSPQPIDIMIGRWVQAASAGQLIGGPLSPAQQLISAWTAITSGGVDLTVNATPCNLTGLNFSAVTNLNGVASVIQTALAAIVAGTTCTWNPSTQNFVVTSPTTGTSSLVSFATAGAGTDISVMLEWRNTAGNGAYTSPGLAAESAVSALTLFDANFGQQWYAAFICGAADADHLACAAYIEAAATKHLYAVNTQEGGVLTTGTTDIAYELQQLAYKRTIVQYSSTSLYAICSYMGKAISVDYNANSSVIILMFKQEPGIVGETLSATQAANAAAKNCNVFADYNNGSVIIQYGTTASGFFTDVITGTDWLALAIQTAVFNLLYQSATKIPQTDAGMHLIQTTIESVCAQAVLNGLLAPGIWTAGGFGQLSTGQNLAAGYYVYAPPIASQSASARSARVSVPFQIAAKLAGGVQSVNVQILVNQ